MHDSWFTGEMTLKSWRVNLTSRFEIAAEFNTELQHPSESVSFPDQPLFSWFKNLNTLQRGLFYVFFLTCICVVPCVPAHPAVLYRCVCSEHTAPPGRVPAPAQALPEHTHTRVSTPTHSQPGGCAPHLPPNMLSLAWERDLHLVWLHLCILESQCWNTLERMYEQNTEYYPAPQP